MNRNVPNRACAMAIKITPENADKIAVVNDGVAPFYEGFYTGSYFVKPYDPNIETSVVAGYIFDVNWKAASESQPINDTHLVDIIEI